MTYKPPYQKRYMDPKRRKKRSFFPFFIFLIIIAGLVFIGLWLRDMGFTFSFGSTPEPTGIPVPTSTLPPGTATFTLIPTETLIPSETPTPTASAPFLYVVQSDEFIITIAEKFDVDYLIIMALNGLTNDSVLYVGDELIIPNPGMEFPRPTDIPPNLPRGRKIEYFVMPGDSLKIIAEKFLSTIEAIIDANEIEDPNAIFPGQILLVPVNLVTPTFGPTPTSEVLPATETPTVTPTP